MDTFAATIPSRNLIMDNIQRSLTKIEVLLDKINLLHTAIQAADQPDKYDLTLMRRYAQQLADALEDLEAKEESAPNPASSPTHRQDISPASTSPDPSPPAETQEDTPDEPEDTPLRNTTTDKETPEPKSSDAGIAPSFEFVAPGEEEDKQANLTKKKETGAAEEGNDTVAENAPPEADHTTRSAEGASLNDIFKQEQPDLAEKLKDQPISSLQQDIDLNEKFWFIQELFDGDGELFKTLLNDLDRLRTFEDAEACIRQATEGRFDWSQQQNAARKFMRLVRRRYV